MHVEYSHNNSGGRWWLTDEHWRALENAGWEVEWYAKEPVPPWRMLDKGGRSLGALASRATRRGLGLREAVAEWESVTGESSTDAGCPCCGAPHYFGEYDDDGKFVRSGPDTEYVAKW